MSTKLKLNDLDIYYGDFHAVQSVNMDIPAQAVTAFIGRPAAVSPPCCAP